MKKIIFFIMLLIGALLKPDAAVANYPVVVSLLAEKTAVSAREPFMVAVKFIIADGWLTYWKNAGEAGEPTAIKLSLPEGFKAGEIKWQLPERLETAGFKEFGYTKQAYHFIEITPPDNFTGQDIPIKAEVTFMACGKECLPQAKTLAMIIPVAENGSENKEFTAQINKIPRSADRFLQGSDDGKYIAVAFESRLDMTGKLDFFPYFTPSPVDEIFYKNGSIYLRKSGSFKDNALISGVVKDENNHAFELKVSEGLWETGLAFILLLAFGGGLILNFMPCVFPVISLKIFGIIKADAKTVRSNSLMYALGIIVSFMAVALLIMSFKSAGHALGWGFQLQNPAFVLFLVCLMMILGLMFSGFITVGTFWLRFANGTHGAFVSGVLAVLLSSPCVAPFMGSALAFALSSSMGEAFGVFSMLGLGMAFPFVLLSFWRGWIKYMPRSGRWTKLCAEILALPLYATAVWLVLVLERQTGDFGFAIALSLQLLIVCAALFKKKVLWLGFAFMLAGALYTIEENPQPRDFQNKEIKWQAYSENKLNDSLKKNQPVFINFSAAWCLTCLVNEKIALDLPQTAALFKEKGIVPFYADFSSKNEELVKTLNKYGKNGVPLYVFYGKGKEKEPIILPRIITFDVLSDYVNED